MKYFMMFLSGCSKEEEVPKEAVRPVKMVVFGAQGSQAGLRYPGRVFADETVQVAFEVPGKINELPVAKGQSVKKGDLLARLDRRDYANDLEAAEAAAEESRTTLGRLEQAAKSGAVPQVQVDEARARLRISEATVKIKQKAFDDSQIHADFDGIVADRYVQNFQNINAKEPILMLQDISNLEVRVSVPEGDVVGAPTGDLGRVIAIFSALPGREFELKLKESVSVADSITQTYRVTFTMPNPADAELYPGMTAMVNWFPPVLGEVKNLVPAVAVIGQQDGVAWVWIFDSDTSQVAKRTVKVGQIIQGDQIQILEGLEVGDQICVSGAHHLREGMLVRPL